MTQFPLPTPGAPVTLVGFHGTNCEFEQFDLGRAGTNFANAISRHGIFFSSERYLAESVADQVTEEFGGAARVVEASLHMDRPSRIDMQGAQDAGKVLSELEKAKAGGNDGMIIDNWDDGLSAEPETQYVVFHPEQIKILNPPAKAKKNDQVRLAGKRRKP